MLTSYANTEQLISRLPSLATRDESELEAALETSSRWIDAYCSRRFYLDDTATDRVFAACDLYVLDLGAFEIGASTGVTVKVDDGSGLFATTVSASAYQLEPVNAPYAVGGARPYTRIRLLSTSWPISYGVGRLELVKVTAKYGWPQVPAVVREACLSLTIDRVENPSGVRSESIDGYSVRYSTAEGDAAGGRSSGVKPSLAAYRRAVVA